MNVDAIHITSLIFMGILHLVQSSDKRETFRTFLLNIEDVTQLNENLKEDLHRINETNKELQADNKALKEQVTEMNQTISNLQLRLAGEGQ